MKLRIVLAALAIGAVPIVVGCSAEQTAKFESTVDAAKARALHDAKALSARFTAAAVRLAAMAPSGIAAAPLARIQASDVRIQAATDLDLVLKIYARTAIQGGDDLLRVAEFVPGAKPYADALRSVLDVLRVMAP
jgi:hypothetical protein